MSLDPTAFKTIVPSRYITFTIPNPLLHFHYFNSPHLRIAVLDSPLPNPEPTQIAAMLVPINRESDWNFNTQEGHLQLLLNFPHLSRLILIGNTPNSEHPTSYNSNGVVDSSVVEENLMPFLIEAFCRTVGGALTEIPFLVYEDEVVRSVVLDRCVGPFVGEILIEDVELEMENGGKEFRRRLRFKRMPNLVQTQIKIQPKKVDFLEFEIVDDGVLVHPYLNPMVAGLSVIGPYLDAQVGNGVKPKALCLGVGGGALVGFLSSQFGFQILGIEADNVVLQVARKYFGLENSKSIHLRVGDALEMIQNSEHLDDFDGKFDVIMVDLDSSDASIGMSAPPIKFVEKSVLLATRKLLEKNGVVIINVIPSDQSSYKFVITEFQQVFAELYEIDVGNGENFVLIASASETEHVEYHHQSKFLNKLKQVSGSYVDSIQKLDS